MRPTKFLAIALLALATHGRAFATIVPLLPIEPLSALPALPLTTDSVAVTVRVFGCVSFNAQPQIAANLIRIDGASQSGCAPGPPVLITRQYVLPPLPAGAYSIDAYIDQHPYAFIPLAVRLPAAAIALANDRFVVTVKWHDPRAGAGVANGERLTDRSASYWFFDSSNPELTIKILDGRQVNGHVWVFIGSMTDVGFDVTVADGQGGCSLVGGELDCPSRTYSNPPGTNRNVLDTTAF